MFSLINLYLAKKFINVWLLTIVAFSVLIVLFDFSEFYRVSSSVQASIKLRILYSLYRIPNDIINFYILHVSFASLLAFWVLGRSGEFLAITCSGKNPIKIVFQLLILIIPIMLLFSAILSSIAAYSMQEREIVKAKIYNKKIDNNIVDRSDYWFTFNINNDFYYAQFKTLNKIKSSLYNVSLYQISNDYLNLSIHEIEEIQVIGNKWYLINNNITNFSGKDEFIKNDIWQAPIKYALISKGINKIEQLSFLNIISTINNLKNIGTETSKYLFKFAYILILPFILSASLIWSFAAAYNKSITKNVSIWKWVIVFTIVSQLSVFGYRIISSVSTESYINAILLSLVFPLLSMFLGYYVLYYQTHK